MSNTISPVPSDRLQNLISTINYPALAMHVLKLKFCTPLQQSYENCQMTADEIRYVKYTRPDLVPQIQSYVDRVSQCVSYLLHPTPEDRLPYLIRAIECNDLKRAHEVLTSRVCQSVNSQFTIEELNYLIIIAAQENTRVRATISCLLQMINLSANNIARPLPPSFRLIFLIVAIEDGDLQFATDILVKDFWQMDSANFEFTEDETLYINNVRPDTCLKIQATMLYLLKMATQSIGGSFAPPCLSLRLVYLMQSIEWDNQKLIANSLISEFLQIAPFEQDPVRFKFTEDEENYLKTVCPNLEPTVRSTVEYLEVLTKQFANKLPQVSLDKDEVSENISGARLCNDIQKYKTKLSAIVREVRIVTRPELVGQKLERQFIRTQKQAELELDKRFVYQTVSESFESQAPYSIIRSDLSGYNVCICLCQGHKEVMEDEFLASTFDLTIGETTYPIQLFGIFDGHGGREAAVYVKENLSNRLHAALNLYCSSGLGEVGIWNALKQVFVSLKYSLPQTKSGTTATVAMILDGKLWTANVGDSRTILDNGVQLTEDAKPGDPYYRTRIELRGGSVSLEGRTYRIHGALAVGRSVGDQPLGEAVSARPKITVSDFPQDSSLILASDGIYDVASTRQIAAAVRENKHEPIDKLALSIVYSAINARSGDNCSLMIISKSL